MLPWAASVRISGVAKMAADTPATPSTPGQRTLAAIVFTDVVSFSSRMHSDEVGTLKLLQRDFAEMRRLCTEHEGAVLKTTGDGLLLTFTSAVQAVACALAMQRQFAAESKDLAPGGPLQHRIGIHLGDVLVQDKDVMGDGVNIAARLQAEAEPGGICISQTVYDVVKNKLEMQAVSLGARDLKNIAQAMPVYRLLLEAQALGSGKPEPAGGAKKPGRKLALVGGLVAAAVIAAVAGTIILRRGKQPAAAEPAPAPAAVPTAAAVNTTPVPAANAAGGDLAGELAKESSSRRDVMRQMHAQYLDKYDFNGLVLALRDKGESPDAPLNLQQTLRSAEQLVRMKSWLDLSLGRYSKDHPLLVHDLSGDAAKDARIYLAADQRVVYLTDGAPVPRDWSDLKPAEFGALVVSALREAKAVARPVTVGAQAFARLYALPAMTEALNSARLSREKQTQGR